MTIDIYCTHEDILKLEPKKGEHVIVYQTSRESERLVKRLKALKDEQFIVYGFNRNEIDGNLTYKEFNEDELPDIASLAFKYGIDVRFIEMMPVGAADAGGKLSFERYVMGEAFREILTEANIRLQIMTGGKFELIHQVEASRANAAAGLDIDVMDHSSETVRKAGSLSGGEGFQVSMALALGLSDVVQNHAGGTEIDAMFIDEGFGSLDDVVLGSAVQVLEQLSQGSRQIGIISHVSKLEECISKKIIVKGSEQGSRIQIVF